MCHELREPLAAIKGSVATLLEDATALDPAEAREFHRIIAAQADHMRGLIGDLLDAGRIDSGTLSVAPEPSEVARLVEHARSTFVGGGGRHAIAVDLPAGLPPAMAGHLEGMQHLNPRIGEAGRARFWFHALRNRFITVADRELMLPTSTPSASSTMPGPRT